MLPGSSPLSFCTVEHCRQRANGAVCSQSAFDRSWAEFYMRSIQRDPAAMFAIRALAFQHGFGRDSRSSEAALADWISSQLAAGRIRICDPFVNAIGQFKQDTGIPAPPPSAAPERAFPLAARQQNVSKSSGSAVPVEQAAFPADVDVAALAQTLKNAAQAGVPFCEECQRAAAQRA